MTNLDRRPDRLLRLKKVAELLDLPPSTLYGWRHRREGPPSFKIGENVVYRESELNQWIEAQEAATRRGSATPEGASS